MRASAGRPGLAIAITLGVALAAILLGGCTTPASPSASSAGFKSGDRVAAPFGGGTYIGTVQNVTGTTANVRYDDDQITRTVQFADLIPIVPRSFSVGDQVMAVWSSGKFYPGTVTAAKPGDVYTVKWDDGSPPSDVEASKIFKP